MMRKMLKIVIYAEKKPASKTEVMLTPEHQSIQGCIKLLEQLLIPAFLPLEPQEQQLGLTSNPRKY